MCAARRRAGRPSGRSTPDARRTVSGPRLPLDTNIGIYIRQRFQPHVLERLASLSAADAAISVITYGELHYGAMKSWERDRVLSLLDQLINLLPVLPMLLSAGDASCTIRADREPRGEVIGNNDLWIAAHALTAGLVLATDNRHEFSQVEKLQLADWSSM